VNIDELKAADIEDESITGGYLLEFDTHYDEEYKFKTEILNLPVNLKSPDENVPDIQLNYIKDYVNNIEKLLATHENFSKISSLIDIDSYIDWWLLNELVCNWEPNHPKSSYMYKKRDGKLYAGPAWDYDWGTLTGSENWRIKKSLWMALRRW
jgi:spore coat protein CotH